MREHDFEPVWGLPGRPPAGETALWQGRPDWRCLARHGFHLRLMAAYLGALWLLLAVTTLSAGLTEAGALRLAETFGMVGAALAVTVGFAWAIARTTAYTITNRRVVLRFGIALAKTINLPFALVDGATLRVESGDISLQMRPTQRIAYLVLWPHARPWRLLRAQPMLRGLRDAEQAAQILGRALAASTQQPAQVVRLPAGSTQGAGQAVPA